ncbi:M48 family metallopeptidase [Geomonas sp. RF6]|uniref:M48 family metallopeptidase n=1 Tax=Geomonas sp. RF6 TaxID=2897342 RepID=UPI001E305434|nr:M48 family metallopeptidase [Geomonas sp. RF6]UFS70765.1 M48 family metallopeptidase [Geomonas sp. RF6]
MSITKQLFFSTVLTVSVVFGCATTSPSKVGGFNLVSVDEEKQLGDKFAVEIEKQHQVVNDPEVQAYIDRVGKKLLTGVDKVQFPYTFKVVKDESVNAFAIPGGHTYVNTGLIKAADNENELAAVMAHEINHVVARHSTQQMTKQYGYELVAGLLLGQNQNQLAKLAADLFGKAGLLYYSRDMENQADYLGVQTMYKAGYDPKGMSTFFQKLQAQHSANPGKIAQFLSSHPQTGERIQNVNEEIAKLPPKQFPAVSEAEFQKVKAKVKGM